MHSAVNIFDIGSLGVNVARCQDLIADFVRKAVDTAGFEPRWKTITWSKAHAWVQISADLVIAATSFLMTAELIYYCPRKPRAPYASLLCLLGIFIFAGGLTHLFEAVMFWWPAYRLTTLAGGVTAVVSLLAAGLLAPLAPRAMALRSPVEFQREIFQRRRTELELRQVHAQLEGVIEERTAELASKNEEMEQFLNTVSHDLKSPVVTCLGLTGMLREDLQAGRADDASDTVSRIERSVTRMRQLIDDLLQLSRVGRVRFERGEVNTHEIVCAIAEEFGPRLKEAGAVLRINGQLPVVHADAHWLTEVFENLITNAIKYGCDNPNPSIILGSSGDAKASRFFVRDNGLGIDPANHAQVLEPFRRLRVDKEGSGMGLAIVVRIIKMHGGQIWIESESGKGATFWFTIPHQAADGPAPGPAENTGRLIAV